MLLLLLMLLLLWRLLLLFLRRRTGGSELEGSDTLLQVIAEHREGSVSHGQDAKFVLHVRPQLFNEGRLVPELSVGGHSVGGELREKS